jgi:hypothetical protein
VRVLSAGGVPGVPVAVETMWSIPVIAWEVSIYYNPRLPQQILGMRGVLPVVAADDGPRVVTEPCPLMFEDGSVRAYHGELQPDNSVKLKTMMFPSLLAFVKAMRGGI